MRLGITIEQSKELARIIDEIQNETGSGFLKFEHEYEPRTLINRIKDMIL